MKKTFDLDKMLVKLTIITQKSLFRQKVRESFRNGTPYIQLALPDANI